MILYIYIDDMRYSIDVPQEVLEEGEDFFAKLDRDMDRGWTMGRHFIPQPNTLQRCQIVADRILTALETERDKALPLMAGYILSRLPGVHGVQVDVSGEMFNTEFLMEPP
ncbi:MAG: hypothetical protein D6819_00465 [Gammaproteobacteria bacterium]|nr:MAG: hypothetical protein D6819_00465 [Gammaproteobacteria bacterium]